MSRRWRLGKSLKSKGAMQFYSRYWKKEKRKFLTITAGACLLVLILMLLPLSIVEPSKYGSGNKAGAIVHTDKQVPQTEAGSKRNAISNSEQKKSTERRNDLVQERASADEMIKEPDDQAPYVGVYVADKQAVERVPLEIYVRGVVAAEMPERFELEALKAQAIAARTFIVRRLMHAKNHEVPQGADVLGSVAHQAYEPLAKLEDRENPMRQKLNRAVNETAGLILTYKDQPIQAAYFSTSNGHTENAEDYWASPPIPYLRSVPSPWDRAISPRFTNIVKLDAADMLRKLGVASSAVPAFEALAVDEDAASEQGSRTVRESIKVLSRTKGQRIAELSIGDTKLTGRQLRERLGLTSSSVEWKWEDGKVVLTSYGYGHGVGMSQYGAQGMALKGSKAEQIVTYYYVGTTLKKIEDVWPKKP
ncbi:stage II sporulation protein D [Paenibacillus arenosi]|uniref:Stage II sporulation protein D n=1 Tax=Paenibacillus arenosi TaxID=2774142 RepID=A0ABR9AW38_9BACL|nr:stage II sporulation protein D [Paenibacillus arenosi]MBD8498222.1 stage II sporulation protein D [Paenibacillus arenosi]